MMYIGYPIAAIAVIAAAYLGLTQSLGAHAFWATKTAWIGVPIGLVAALALARFGKMPRLVFFAVLLVAAGAAAHFGRVEFAASYAENALAGKFWYFGWIGVAATATAFLAALLSRNRI